MLLNSYLNLNVQENVNGMAPIHIAVIKGSIKIIDKLIKLGCDINIQDFYGNTPIHYAILEKRINIISLFENLNVDYNLENINGNLPLHTILEKKVKIPIENILSKSNINIQNNKGNTCMHLLVQKLANIFQNIGKKEINLFIKNRNNQNILI